MFFCVPVSVAEGSIISLVAIIPMSITLNQILKRYRNLNQGQADACRQSLPLPGCGKLSGFPRLPEIQPSFLMGFRVSDLGLRV